MLAQAMLVFSTPESMLNKLPVLQSTVLARGPGVQVLFSKVFCSSG